MIKVPSLPLFRLLPRSNDLYSLITISLNLLRVNLLFNPNNSQS